MSLFNGNSILIVDNDRVYTTQLKELLEERGAMVSKSNSLEEARSWMKRCDFDMIICSHNLDDGPVRELVEWCHDSLSTLPVIAAMGNCTRFERNQLEKMGVRNFFSKTDSPHLFDQISKALFSIEAFGKDFLEAQLEKGIAYELKVGGKRIVVRALEILGNGIFLSFESPFSLGHPAVLVVKVPEDIRIDSFYVSGTLMGPTSEGQLFKVNEEDLVSWKNLLRQLDKKQGEVTEFLKKASGK